MYQKYGSLLVLSGPSGSGKSSLYHMLKNEFDNIEFSISTTSRTIRGKEINGKDYHFISKQDFESGIDNGDFIEWAEVHGNYYGTSRKTINQAILKPNSVLVLDIDVQGFLQLQDEYRGYLTSVFIFPPSKSILKQRLLDRSTDTQEIITKRLENALGEIKHFIKYDYFIINDNLDIAYSELKYIYNSMKNRSSLIDEKQLILDWTT